MVVHTHIAGAILAGGGAVRMGGGDKGLADLAGRPMLAHVIERFAPQVTTLIVNANGPASRFAAFGLDIVPDPGPGNQGPLAGLVAAFAWAKRTDADIAYVVTVSTDVPFLPRDLVERLHAGAIEAGTDTAIAASVGRLHPVIGHWPVALADDLAGFLKRGERSAEAFAKRHGAVAVSFPLTMLGRREVDPFFNANTPTDLAAANALIAGPTLE